MASSANEIRARRKRLGLSAEEVAHRAGLAVSTVRLVEHGWTPAGGKSVQKIERALAAGEVSRA